MKAKIGGYEIECSVEEFKELISTPRKNKKGVGRPKGSKDKRARKERKGKK